LKELEIAGVGFRFQAVKMLLVVVIIIILKTTIVNKNSVCKNL